jgi:hypothetical protein
MRSGSNRVIELNQKMLILKRFVTKNDLSCVVCEDLMRNCLCLNIVLGLDTSTTVSTGGKHRGDKG